jgi:hypothetical protein
MPSDEQKPKRAPRGSGPVSQAFLKALESIPPHSQGEVAKAALVLIRDELKGRRDQLKAKPAKQGASKPKLLGRKTVAVTEIASRPIPKVSTKLKPRKHVSMKAA